MQKPNFYFPILFCLSCLFSCKTDSTEMSTSYAGIDFSNMDTTTTAANDLFKYANGQWLENNEIPADRSRWGSFDELRKMTSKQALNALEGAKGKDYAKDSDQAKALRLYESAMNVELMNEQGINPLKPYLSKIESINSISDIQTYIEETTPLGDRTLFSFGVNPDLKKSSVNAAYLGTGSVGLPDRDYYLNDGEDGIDLRAKYKSHIIRMLGFIGYDAARAEKAAADIIRIETKLEEPTLDKVQRRNTPLLYNKRSVADLNKMAPSINWDQYFRKIGVDIDTIIVTQPRYIEAMEKIIQEEPISVLKDLMAWNEINGAASFLSEEIDNANFDFYGKELQGSKEQQPRWERVLDMTNNVMGEAVGKLYVDEYFPPEAKQIANEMVADIKVAFGERIQKLDWMSQVTKTKALEKLNKLKVKIAYPDKWKDYKDLKIDGVNEGGSYASNLINVATHTFKEDLEKIGKEVDKSEWFMAPQVVNAYYNPLFNEIVFPAAILQPPFFNFKADAAVNYGGVGAVIGHEISHAFDDSGARFDSDGNLNNWWTEEDEIKFKERNKKLIEQFDAYEPLPGENVNGAFTLGENIGDLGGLNVALDGLMNNYKKNGRPDNIDGLSPEQRFFISWATVWRTKIRDEALSTQMKTDPHSPANYRATAAPSNMDAFYKAFNVKETDAMYIAPEDRVRIW
jgi:putative endopeptidase